MIDGTLYNVTPFCQNGVTGYAGTPAVQPYAAPYCVSSTGTNWLENTLRHNADMIVNYQNTRNYGLMELSRNVQSENTQNLK